MNDAWVPSLPSPPQPASNPFPPGNTWNSVAGCSVSPDQPSFVYGVVITGIPAAIGAPYAWSITLNDGSTPPNFSIDHYDASGNLLGHPLTFSGVDGSARFNNSVTAVALTITTGQLVVPSLDQLTIPGGPIGSYLGSASPSGALAWFNLPAPVIPTDAPSDGNLYGRVNGGWSSGGTFTQPLYIYGANNLALVGPNQTQRAILAGTGTSSATASWRWQMVLADQTSESGANSGSNFALNAISDSGSLMPGPSALAITRANNAAVFGGVVTVPGQIGGAVPSIIVNKAASGQNSAIAGQLNGANRWTLSLADPSGELGGNLGSNFTITRYTDAGATNGLPPLQISRQTGNTTFNYGLTVTGVLTLAAPANLSIGGGSPDQVLTTDGAGNLSWSTVTGGGAGGVDEAPQDGTTYARNDANWVHLTSADITDWATQLANYYPTSNPAGYQTAAQVTAALQPYALSSSLSAYLPLTAGPTAPLTGVLFSSNYVMLNGPGNARAIAGATSGNVPRWALYPGDATAESGANAGSNFTLTSYSDTGAVLGNPLAINRATSVATFMTLPSFPGGSNGQALTTNGAGALSWAGPYALPASVPNPSTTLPLADGTAAVGTATTYARADHVHPVVYMGDNRIINGDMRIDQRNNGASGTANGVYTVDRWYFNCSASTYGSWGQNLNAIATPVGFPYYLGFTSSSAHTIAAGDYTQFNQAFEADAVSDFAFGTANARSVTLSFWVYSSKTGTFSGGIQNYAGTRSYPFSYSIPTANTWTFITVTIPGDTAGTWVMSGNGGALVVIFDIGTGTTHRGPANVWASANYGGVTGAQSIINTNAATWYVTGVKLEVGSIATPFNRQSLAKSMADCQRYYQSHSNWFVGGWQSSGGNANITLPIPWMRAAPSVSFIDTGYSNGSNLQTWGITNGDIALAVTITATGNGQATFNCNLSAEL